MAPGSTAAVQAVPSPRMVEELLVTETVPARYCMGSLPRRKGGGARRTGGAPWGRHGLGGSGGGVPMPSRTADAWATTASMAAAPGAARTWPLAATVTCSTAAATCCHWRVMASHHG